MPMYFSSSAALTMESRSNDSFDDDLPRDEFGRRLDPYGNPVPDDRDL